mmetsp:Transcript_97944/g.189102  ORF Transcript_97944/g.189102 Transcript_97944/m.189102 type:complete len:109 (+) Transcript_97944:239-565(+)
MEVVLPREQLARVQTWASRASRVQTRAEVPSKLPLGELNRQLASGGPKPPEAAMMMKSGRRSRAQPHCPVQPQRRSSIGNIELAATRVRGFAPSVVCCCSPFGSPLEN